MGFLLFHHACTVDISITCLVFIMFWVFTFPPFEYFQYLSPLCLWYLSTIWIFPIHVFIICCGTFPPCGYFYSMPLLYLIYILYLKVLTFPPCGYFHYMSLSYVCGTFPPCGYFHYMSLSYVWGTGTYFSTMWLFPLPGTCLYYVYGTYFSTMWMFSSNLPRTTLCRSSLKAAMIPFILSNIMEIFSPLQKRY